MRQQSIKVFVVKAAEHQHNLNLVPTLFTCTFQVPKTSLTCSSFRQNIRAVTHSLLTHLQRPLLKHTSASTDPPPCHTHMQPICEGWKNNNPATKTLPAPPSAAEIHPSFLLLLPDCLSYSQMLWWSQHKWIMVSELEFGCLDGNRSKSTIANSSLAALTW